MRLDPSKYEFLCISNKRSPIHHSYYLNNHLLQSVSSAKYLGVIDDAKLSWNKHVSYISTRTLNLFRHNMYFCDVPAKNKAFRALILPVLDCASAVWNPHTHKNISTLEKYKIVELIGCVVAGTTVIVTRGQSCLVNVVVSSIGHFFLHDGSISQ